MTASSARSPATGRESHLVQPLEAAVDLLALHETSPERYPYLLESVACDGVCHRYDILFAVDGREPIDEHDPIRSLNEAFRALRDDSPTPDLPFTGGWFLYLGYELAASLEPTVAQPEFGRLPALVMHRAPAAFLRDCRSGRVLAVAEAGYDDLYARMREDAAAASAAVVAERGPLIETLDEESPAVFRRAVSAAKRYIADGDIYQANLSRAWTGRVGDGVTPVDIYRRLRNSNPAPFSGLARLGDGLTVVSSSPERLVRVTGRRVESRPIAGTRPRGATPELDRSLARELIANEKERAEHVMLIDLIRNDIGRISDGGSVHVDEFMVIEPYSHVQHIVSNVAGTLRDGAPPGDVIAAVFPGGTITGCPKVRCMQIIAELEQSARGPYTGSMGYLNRNGGLDLNILIRTLLVDGNRVVLRAGGGIVADSDPDRELAETRAKARGLLLALDATV